MECLRGDSPTEIVVDDRERDSGVAERLRCRPSLRVTIRRLDLGDYLLANRVLVERKTVSDFAVSMVDGRLFTQACRMAEGRYAPAMVIEGPSADAGVPGMTREAVQGALVSLQLFLGIPCFRSRDPPETADLLRFVADQMRRKLARGLYRHGHRPKGQLKRRLFVLQGLPGIGPSRAARLLERFGTIEAVFMADASALAMVAGIGTKTANAIRDLVAPQAGDVHSPP